MNNLQTFTFKGYPLRTRLVDGEPWLLAKDVADSLGYQNGSRDINRHVDPEDRIILDEFDGTQRREMIFINESGMFSLALSSKLPTAKKFKRWVTNEVLPAIRKTGSYQVPQDPMTALELMFEATKQTKEEVQEVKDRVDHLENNAPLSPGEYGYIGKLISRKIFQIGRDRSYNMNKLQKAELFKALNTEIAAITGVRTRTQLKNQHFKQVVEFIDDWEPSKATAIRVQQLDLLIEE